MLQPKSCSEPHSRRLYHGQNVMSREGRAMLAVYRWFECGRVASRRIHSGIYCPRSFKLSLYPTKGVIVVPGRNDAGDLVPLLPQHLSPLCMTGPGRRLECWTNCSVSTKWNALFLWVFLLNSECIDYLSVFLCENRIKGKHAQHFNFLRPNETRQCLCVTAHQ